MLLLFCLWTLLERKRSYSYNGSLDVCLNLFKALCFTLSRNTVNIIFSRTELAFSCISTVICHLWCLRDWRTYQRKHQLRFNLFLLLPHLSWLVLSSIRTHYMFNCFRVTMHHLKLSNERFKWLVGKPMMTILLKWVWSLCSGQIESFSQQLWLFNHLDHGRADNCLNSSYFLKATRNWDPFSRRLCLIASSEIFLHIRLWLAINWDLI